MRAAVAALILLAACGGESSPPKTSPLWSDGRYLRDADGRIAVLRGINARVEGVFDVTFDDGRIPLEPIPPLTADDCRRMRELGLDLLRLPINWSGIEPADDAFDEDYLRRVDAAIDCAGDAGLFGRVDLHQDAYSKEIGEDGAPLWAIVPEPDMLLEGPLEDLGSRRTSRQVLDAFETFFDETDPAGLQAEFFEVLALVAARWAEHPAVIGFEIFNEPVTSEELTQKFHFQAAEHVAAAAPGKLVFFEPTSIRNLTDYVDRSSVPFPVPNAVYAPHIYTYVFAATSEPLENVTPADLEASVAGAVDEAAAWETPMVIGEFGIGPDMTNADLWMGVQNELHDRYLVGNAFWVWKEETQGAWGVHDHDAETGTWTERPQVVGWISRIHPARVAGTPVEVAFDRETGALRMEVTGARLPHQVYVPERSAATFAVRCDGEAIEVARDAGTGLIDVTCDGVLDVTP